MGSQNNYRRLPLEGLTNARELGGYPTPYGATRYGVFLRSEVPRELTEGDKQFLRDYGVTLDIDFRGDRELSKVPDALAAEPWLEYKHIPMFDSVASLSKEPNGKRLREREDFRWGDHYIHMAEEYKHWVKAVLTAMAEAKGTVLFHCTTGKDRTGIISALILGICGVSHEDIAADYCVSEIYLGRIYGNIGRYFEDGTGIKPGDPFFSTAPENMQMLMEHIESSYQGAERYALLCGVSPESIAAIKYRLIGNNREK